MDGKADHSRPFWSFDGYHPLRQLRQTVLPFVQRLFSPIWKKILAAAIASHPGIQQRQRQLDAATTDKRTMHWQQTKATKPASYRSSFVRSVGRSETYT
jgi:hypothetical protein